jgi:transposase
MEHGLNTNLVFKWRRSLHAGEYDPVDLLPVKIDSPEPEIMWLT